MSALHLVNELRDELACPICLESFKDPVNLDCGHNYCQACISKCWEASGTGLCPQCRKSLTEGELRPNTQLEAVVEIARGLEGECKKHQEVFSLFCKEDRTPICSICRVSREHRDHPVIPIEEAAEEYKEQLLSHRDRVQRVSEEQSRRVAAEEREYQTLLILKQREQLICNHLEVTLQDLRKRRNKNTKGLLLLNNLLAEINQKCQQPGIELLKDVDSTLSRCEQVKGEEEAPVDSLTELKSRAQGLSERQKFLCDLLKHFRVELAPELGPLENISFEVQRQVSDEDPKEDVPDNREQEDSSVCLLDCEDVKCASDRCEEEENNILKPNTTEGYKPDLQLGNYRIPKERVYQGCIVVLVLAILAGVFIGVGRSNSPVAAKEPDTPDCPEGWIGNLGKCYYFSQTEGNWTYSQKNCSSLNSSLAVIDTFQDLGFLLRYKGSFDHWIGLWRDQEQQPWKWPNGTEFNHLFQIQGTGDCVYLSSNYARSVSCHLERHWICSKLDGYTERKKMSHRGTQSFNSTEK